MSVRKPPANLAGPSVGTFVVTFEAGALLERIHDRNYRPNEFNPCNGAPMRFAPIQDLQGDCVPSLYAGDTLESAIYETIFHDIPAEARRKTVPRTLVEGRAHGRLEVLRDLKLASLRGPDLTKWRISRDSLTMTSPKLCPETARWAEAIHHQFPEVEGLIWTSNQCDPDTAYLFFGDRVASTDFRVVRVRDGRLDAGLPVGRAPGGPEKRDHDHGLRRKGVRLPGLTIPRSSWLSPFSLSTVTCRPFVTVWYTRPPRPVRERRWPKLYWVEALRTDGLWP